MVGGGGALLDQLKSQSSQSGNLAKFPNPKSNISDNFHFERGGGGSGGEYSGCYIPEILE